MKIHLKLMSLVMAITLSSYGQTIKKFNNKTYEFKNNKWVSKEFDVDTFSVTLKFGQDIQKNKS
jgi:hypothetical protein